MSQDENPRVFIGAPDDPPEIIQLIEEALDRKKLDSIPWEIIPDEPLSIFTSELTNRLGEVDAAIFVFPNNLNGEKLDEFTDKVIFESGFFANDLGVNRIVWLIPKQDLEPAFPRYKEKFFQGIQIVNFLPDLTNFQAAIPLALDVLAKGLQKQKARPVPGEKNNFQLDPPSGITEKEHEYTIRITNSEGNTVFTRWIKLEVNKSGTLTRRHEVYSDSTFQKYEELELKVKCETPGYTAKDIKVSELDQSGRKVFDVVFDPPLKKGVKIAYSYTYIWKEIYPKKDVFNYFNARPNSSKIKFKIITPADWPLALEDISVFDKYSAMEAEGRKKLPYSAEPSLESAGDLKIYRLALKKVDARIEQIQLEWYLKLDTPQVSNGISVPRLDPGGLMQAEELKVEEIGIPPELIDQINEAISQDELRKALDLLGNYIKDRDQTRYNSIIALKGRLTTLGKQVNGDIISEDTATIKRNRIRQAILHYLEE